MVAVTCACTHDERGLFSLGAASVKYTVGNIVATYVKIEPENEDGVTQNVDDDEGYEDVSFESRHELGTVMLE